MSTRWRISIIIILLIRCFYILIFNKPVSIIFPEDTVTVTGYISNYKEERISSNRYRLKILKYNDTEILDKSSILIVTDPYQQDLQYGNVIKITGSIENPKDFIIGLSCGKRNTAFITHLGSVWITGNYQPEKLAKP